MVWADLDPSAGHEQDRHCPPVVASNDKLIGCCTLTMTVPITSADTGYPLRLDVGEVPAEPGGTSVHGFAEIEQLKSLDLDARGAVKVGSIDGAGMEKVLSLVFGCLITPDMNLISGH